MFQSFLQKYVQCTIFWCLVIDVVFQEMIFAVVGETELSVHFHVSLHLLKLAV